MCCSLKNNLQLELCSACAVEDIQVKNVKAETKTERGRENVVRNGNNEEKSDGRLI